MSRLSPTGSQIKFGMSGIFLDLILAQTHRRNITANDVFLQQQLTCIFIPQAGMGRRELFIGFGQFQQARNNEPSRAGIKIRNDGFPEIACIDARDLRHLQTHSRRETAERIRQACHRCVFADEIAINQILAVAIGLANGPAQVVTDEEEARGNFPLTRNIAAHRSKGGRPSGLSRPNPFLPA